MLYLFHTNRGSNMKSALDYQLETKAYFFELTKAIDAYRAENVKRDRRISLLMSNPRSTVAQLHKMYKKEGVMK